MNAVSWHRLEHNHNEFVEGQLMPLSNSVKLALKTWRGVFGEDTGVELWVKRRYLRSIHTQVTRESGRGWVQYSGPRFVVVSESDEFPEPRRGVVLKGGCDLPSAFTAAPLIREGIEGTVAIAKHQVGTGGNRSDQILQTLDGLTDDVIGETIEMLKMGSASFAPTLFDPTFTIDLLPEAGEFPKDVVIFGSGSDTTRQIYAHRQHGFVVDPGGWWLNQDLGKVMKDLDRAKWFAKNFKKLGRLPVEDFRKNVGRLVTEVRDRLGAQVIYYNLMTVDPAHPIHNYQLLAPDHYVRRREFAIALADLSHDLGFSVIDVDRILKEGGVDELIDFAHFPADRMRPIGAEVYRVLVDMGVV